MGLWTRKSAADLCAAAGAETESGRLTLDRHLGAGNLMLMGIGGTIGAGIFVITGVAAAQFAGPAVVLSFVVAGLVCLCTALCYAELASMMPVAGGAYTYSYATLGQLIAWIVGWCLTLEYMVAGSAVAVGWSGYFGNLLSHAGMPLHPALSNAPFTLDESHRIVRSAALFNLPAALLVAAIVAIILTGIRKSAKANGVLVAIKVGVILLIILCGAFYVDAENWKPFIPAENDHGRFGLSGIFAGAGVIFFSYVGFDGVATSAQEARNPQRDMSLGLLGALGVCSILYIGMSLVMTGLVPYWKLDVPNPAVIAIEAAGPGLAWLVPLVNIGAMIGLASVVLIAIYSQTRLFYAMSCDGLLPRMFRTVHPNYRTPWGSTLVVGTACFFIAGLFPVSILGELVSMGTMLAFIMVCLSVIVLRYREPDAPRGFRVPFAPFVPIVGAASCLYLMLSLPQSTWARLLVWLAIGLLVYGLYSYRNANAVGRYPSL